MDSDPKNSQNKLFHEIHRGDMAQAGKSLQLPTLHEIAKANQLEKARDLILNGIDVNAIDKEGRTALMYACTSRLARTIIKAGADVTFKDPQGRSALWHAFQQFSKNILIRKASKTLVSHGPDVLLLATIMKKAPLMNDLAAVSITKKLRKLLNEDLFVDTSPAIRSSTFSQIILPQIEQSEAYQRKKRLAKMARGRNARERKEAKKTTPKF